MCRDDKVIQVRYLDGTFNGSWYGLLDIVYTKLCLFIVLLYEK